jgi:hypothetical protein
MAVSNHQMIQEFLQASTLSWCKSDGQLSTLEGHPVIAVFDYSVNATVLTSCNIERGQQSMWRTSGRLHMWENHPTASAVSNHLVSATVLTNYETQRQLSTWGDHTTTFAITNHAVYAAVLTCFDVQRRQQPYVMGCCISSCQCKSTYVLWCWESQHNMLWWADECERTMSQEAQFKLISSMQQYIHSLKLRGVISVCKRVHVVTVPQRCLFLFQPQNLRPLVLNHQEHIIW